MMLIQPQVLENDGTNIRLNIICPMCNESQDLTITCEGYEKYQQGDLIQNCFPELSPAKRELMLSGICGVCWDKNFKVEE